MRKYRPSRALRGLLLGAVLAALASPAAAHSVQLAVRVPDAHLAAALHAALGDRLAALGIDLRIATDTHGPTPDLVLTDDADIRRACAKGTVRPLGDAGTCGLAGPPEHLVLGWDERRDEAPSGWGSLWELARAPGRRGLPAQATGTLEIALLADGVPPDDIYRTLGTEAGQRRAFRRLDQLRPYVVWWTDAPQALRVLRSGAVLMAAAPAGTLADARGIGLQWSDALTQRRFWAIPTHAPHAQATLRALALLRAPEIAADLAPAPPVQARALVIDDVFWAAHPTLQRRFAAWLAAP